MMSSSSSSSSAIRAGKLTKRRSAAMSISDDENQIPKSPARHQLGKSDACRAPYVKRRQSRLHNIIDPNNQLSPELIKVRNHQNVSPFRLGNLPIPRINFDDSDYSENEEASEPETEMLPALPQGFDEMNSNAQMASETVTPRRSVFRSSEIIRRNLFGTSKEQVKRVFGRKMVIPQKPMAPRRPTISKVCRKQRNGNQQQTPRSNISTGPKVRDLSALLKLM